MEKRQMLTKNRIVPDPREDFTDLPMFLIGRHSCGKYHWN